MLYGDDLKKGAWTPEEDVLLQRLVQALGAARWSVIAERIPGRSGKSCRLRWHNHLSPAVKKAPFSEYEDAVILKAHDIHGNKWSVIAKLLPGRTDNAVKNRWNSTLKRKAGTQGLRNRFLARGVTLEMLLTQYAHHAHDNAAPPSGSGHGRGALASSSDCTDSEGDDLDGETPSGGSEGTGGDGSSGSAASDDEGSSPAGMRSHQHHKQGRHMHVVHGAVDVYAAAAAAAGSHGYGSSGGGCYAPHAGGRQPQLRIKTRLSVGTTNCGSAGTMFSDEDDCCETYDFHFPAGGEVVYGTGVSPYPRGPSHPGAPDPADNIQILLEEFAAAGAAAAAAAAGAGPDALDDICGASDTDAAAVFHGACSYEGAVPKRGLLSSLAGAVDEAASPMKKLRIGQGSSPFSNNDEDELPICYADQRGGGASSGGGGAVAAAAAVVRQQQPSLLQDWPGGAAGTAACAAAEPAAVPAIAGDGGAGCGGAGGPLDLLEALPCSIRSCLADAAGLYLANDANGLAA